MDFQDYGIIIPHRQRREGNVKTYCPKCRGQRRNKSDRSLSVNIDEGVWLCHHCGWKGSLDKRKDYERMRNYNTPAPVTITDLPRDMVRWFHDVRKISEQTLKAMKVTASPYRDSAGVERHKVVFNYYLDGERVTYKERTANKKFMMFAGGRVIPYNIDSILGKRECIITEGEMDALACHEAGFRNVISAPTGSNKNLSWLDDFVETHFEDKDVVYIAGDTDEAGRKLRDELIVRLGAERCKLVTWGEDCKDADDVLMKHGAEALRECFANAQDIPLEGVFSESDYHEALADIWRRGWPKGMTLHFTNFDDVLSVETKRLMVVTGIPSSGKSEFIDEMCVRLNIIYGLKVAYFSPENMPFEYHGAKLVEKITGSKMSEAFLPQGEFVNATDYIRDNFFHICPDVPSVDNILAAARWLVRKRGIKILVLDPYNRIEHDYGGDSETTYAGRILDSLSQFAQRNDVLVILMAHPRKVSKDTSEGGIPTMYDINGSANFYNKSDFGLIVHRDKAAGTTLVRVAKIKFRQFGTGGDAIFRYNVRNGRYTPDGQAEDNRNYLRESILDELPKEENKQDMFYPVGEAVPF